MSLNSLSTRLKVISIFWLAIAILSIALTLLFSWRLDGGGAAINDAGSLRMRVFRIAFLNSQIQDKYLMQSRIDDFTKTLLRLKRGDPSRPLFLPKRIEIDTKIDSIIRTWHEEIVPMFEKAVKNHYEVQPAVLQNFVNRIDNLVFLVEKIDASYLNWLRVFQTCLLLLVLFSTCIMVSLLYVWVIRPLKHLQNGVIAIHNGEFGVQVPLDEVSEFAQVDDGFNKMSIRLKYLYNNLEQEVSEKTRDLADKNYMLGVLYDFSHFLNRPQTMKSLIDLFLEKIMAIIPASAGSIRLTDMKQQATELVTQKDLPGKLQESEGCKHLNDCLCNQIINSSQGNFITISTHQINDSPALRMCKDAGFKALEVFKIRYQDLDLGILTLYFKEPHNISQNLSLLVSNLCARLGFSVTQVRLIEESQELAVYQERNLMAQGLHDSIAQTLNYLNLRVQMLESDIKSKDEKLVNEDVQFIKEGIKQCYDDIRELLLNFRTKIHAKNFKEAVESLINRFKLQTTIQTNITWNGEGLPLTSPQQLQFVFILQESLSNIRKHSKAQQVSISFTDSTDFCMQIVDDGVGFDPEFIKEQESTHVGLSIMQERAARIHAILALESKPGCTTVSLTLPAIQRVPA